ncbi:unnamed protein product [Rhizoctonia solani]|uniref:Ketoreductase domain-containing protein n=1 Tax=Rhizoctonia solani TaxID=456999 RepID=A0A8H2X179_9AGAM|nr:unnamed protein product [Rhizoctonia solani]
MAAFITSDSPVVLITGCSSGGIGYALCEAFAAEGCTVYATSRRLESMTSLTHPSIHCLEMDVTSDDSVKKCVEHIVHETGRVDFAIANAGIPCFGPVLDISIEDAKTVMDTNVLGVLRLAQAVFPHMASRKQGTFMTLGSVIAYSAVPWAGLYCASKAAVSSVTEALQMEARALSPDIHVSLIVAAVVKSRFTSNSRFEIPKTSLFKSCAAGIRAVTETSVGSSIMPPSQFAATIVHTALRKQGPPQRLSYGSHVALFWVLRWLPVRLAHWVLWKIYGRTMP